MKIEIVAIDRLRAAWAREAVEDYVARLGRYCPVERKDVKRAGDDARAIALEGERLLALAAPGPSDRLIALDPRGEVLDSPEWARLLREALSAGVGRLVFLVGGAGGLSGPARNSADRLVALGLHTMSHELVQVVLAEQLYRAWTILRGEPYHK